MCSGWKCSCLAAAILLVSAATVEIQAKSGRPAENSPSAPGSGAQPPSPAPANGPPQPETPAGSVGEFEPVLHAQQAKLSTCMDTIVSESSRVIDTAHTAISSWNAAAPNEHEFVSIIGMSYANKSAPNGAAVIVAAPGGNGTCEGASVQIYPVAKPCSAIQAELIKEGRTTAMLRLLPVVETKSGARTLLLPSAGGGCVVVAVAQGK